MNLSDKNFEEISEFASLLFSPEEIATLIGADEQEFLLQMEEKRSKVFNAYYKGFLLTKAKIRKSEIEMAQRDSAPAQALVNKLIDKIERKLKNHE
jgi:hypothetical protein